MNERNDAMRMTRWAVAGMLGMATCLAVSGQRAFAAEGSTQSGDAAGAPGMVVYIDPQTGALLNAPAPGTVPLQLTPELRNAMSTSHDGLAEVPNPGPGGGFKLDLQGRFRSPLIVTIDANGKNRIQHLGEQAGSSNAK